MQSVYLDSTIVKYLYMEPSPRIISSVRQMMTFKWFELLEAEFRMYASDRVRRETEMAGIVKPADCADLMADLTMLEVSPGVIRLANQIISPVFRDLPLTPDMFKPHPLHIAAATVHEIDFLLTWDCINSYILPLIDVAIRNGGLSPPTYKTPADMLEDRGLLNHS